MTRKYGAKKDANHGDVVSILVKTGTPHVDVSSIGHGMPDLIVEVRGRLELWEVKNPKTSYGRKGFSKNQRAFLAKWNGHPARIIRGIDDALAALGMSEVPAQPEKMRRFDGANCITVRSVDDALQAVGAVR